MSDAKLGARAAFTSERFQAPHWSEAGKGGNFAGVTWECLVSLEDRIATGKLIGTIPEVPWNSLFASGVQARPALCVVDPRGGWLGGPRQGRDSAPESVPCFRTGARGRRRS